MGKGFQEPLPFAQPPAPTRRPPPVTVRELQVRAAALEGHALAELAAALGMSMPPDQRRAKGFVGQLAERALGADPTAGDRPDFVDLGVELKTIPLRANGVPTESTFCCSIRMATVDQQTWLGSRLEQRLARVLWLPVEAPPIPLAERRFGRAVLWSPSAEDLAQLAADWEDLIGALGSGGAVDGYEGQLLQIRPKAADASVRTVAPTEDGAGLARPVGFYLRPSFTARILEEARGDSSP